MSKPVDQHTLLSGSSHDATATDESASAAISAIADHPEEKKPEIVIKASDLDMVMKECNLQRQEAIELIQQAHGDIKAALKLYLTE